MPHPETPSTRSREWEQAMLGLVWRRDEIEPANARSESARPALSTAMRVRRLDAELRASRDAA